MSFHTFQPAFTKPSERRNSIKLRAVLEGFGG